MTKICAFDDCEHPHEARGYCTTHYQRDRRHGDPSIVLVHGDFKGDDVSYSQAHKRVYRLNGKATLHDCVDCERQASEWSYDGLDPNELSQEVVSGNGIPFMVSYSPDPDRYHPRCKSCHTKVDGQK